MGAVFVTGFPGFLASELLPRLLQSRKDDLAICLVQSRFAAQARSKVQELTKLYPELRARIHLRTGDITVSGLGLDKGTDPRAEVTEVFHLAAIYDLGVSRDVAMQVNFEGTKNMLEFAKACPNLTRFHYVSTCYVSGRYEGEFTEDDLDKGQTFNNFYEESKFLAEKAVQEEMKKGLPTTIYRPAIVVGDSTGGTTQKYDGPYFVIQWLLRQPRLAVLPVVGKVQENRVNVVPRDFVVDSIAYLSKRKDTKSKVFQLADPEPLSVDEMIRELSRTTRRTIIRVPFPKGMAKAALDRVPGVYAVMKIPSSAVDYFDHPTVYTTTKLEKALEGSGIAIPKFADYSENLVKFVQEHPEVTSSPMA